MSPIRGGKAGEGTPNTTPAPNTSEHAKGLSVNSHYEAVRITTDYRRGGDIMEVGLETPPNPKSYKTKTSYLLINSPTSLRGVFISFGLDVPNQLLWEQ